jgi:hypothetical protein
LELPELKVQKFQTLCKMVAMVEIQFLQLQQLMVAVVEVESTPKQVVPVDQAVAARKTRLIIQELLPKVLQAQVDSLLQDAPRPAVVVAQVRLASKALPNVLRKHLGAVMVEVESQVQSLGPLLDMQVVEAADRTTTTFQLLHVAGAAEARTIFLVQVTVLMLTKELVEMHVRILDLAAVAVITKVAAA